MKKKFHQEVHWQKENESSSNVFSECADDNEIVSFWVKMVKKNFKVWIRKKIVCESDTWGRRR